MNENLGQLMKNRRKQQGMTLKEVSEKTGFSISFLSQLERGKSSATLQSLKKISLALDVSPGYFFEEENREKERQERLAKRVANEHTFTYEDLSGEVVNPAFTPMLITLAPGGDGGELFTHQGQEFLYVLEGQLTVQIEEQRHELSPLESIMFDTTQAHYWFNYTDKMVRFICVAYDE